MFFGGRPASAEECRRRDASPRPARRVPAIVRSNRWLMHDAARRARLVLVSVLAVSLYTTVTAAQFPGELRGRIVVSATGAPVPAAFVELPALGRSALTDATGSFFLRGLEPGRHTLTVRRIGFILWVGDVEVANGQATTLQVTLVSDPLALDGIEVTTTRTPLGAAGTEANIRINRDEIERSGARTAGEIARRAAGVVVREDGPGSAQTISIRGSEADAVLVLVDGVPLNDPVTGVADLSAIPSATIESITVLAGAQGARYGARAQAGVVLVETRAPLTGGELRTAAGSLGEWSAGGEAGVARYHRSGTGGGTEPGQPPLFAVTAGGHLRRVGGEFNFARVPGIDETIERRVNADLSEQAGFLTAAARVAGGELRLRAGAESLDRGIPGRGYAPSTEARQEMDRTRASLGWRRWGHALSGTASVAAVGQRVRYADPAPPFGFPYDDMTRARAWEARGEVGRTGGTLIRSHGLGFDVIRQRADATALADNAPRTRTDLGVFAYTALGSTLGEWDAELSLQARLDRGGDTAEAGSGEVPDETDSAGSSGSWFVNRAVSARLTNGSVTLHVSNGSGFSPPSLGDQFFREGVAVAPNPDLRAERIPSEWEAGASLTHRQPGGLGVAGGIRGFHGNVRGMIVWLPDFRFVWSPRNADVKRRGLESWAEVGHTGLGVRLAGSYSLAAVTFDRPGADNDAQVTYRPRHTGRVTGAWTQGQWHAEVAGSYTGTRYPAAATVNPLPPFWTIGVSAGRDWTIGGMTLGTALHVDRLLDEKDSLIFGFPEAGRRIRLEARVRPAGPSTFQGESW